MGTANKRQGREFTEATKRKLRERVAYMCSRPDCRLLTVGPTGTGEGVLRLGEASHIHSAAENGPRFLPQQSNEECRSFANGIWLCKSHASEVDKDEVTFPAKLLRDWKSGAEAYVTELGCLYTRLRQKRSMISEVLSAMRLLSGLVGPGPSLGPTFETRPGISLTRVMIETDQLLFENGFLPEADLITSIRRELESVMREAGRNGPLEYLDISQWKDVSVKRLMLDVMQLRADSYDRYERVERAMVSERRAELVGQRATIRPYCR